MYSAITLCSYDLFSYLDADSLLATRMIPEALDASLPPVLYGCVTVRLAVPSSTALKRSPRCLLQDRLLPRMHSAMVLRRRVCLFVTTWCSIKLSKEHRPALYDVLGRLLDRSETTVVRVSAAKAVRARTYLPAATNTRVHLS